MVLTEHFAITELRPSDAETLSRLMLKNIPRFKDFFPITLSQNLTPEASGEYIKRKQKENAAKSEFTWAIRENGGGTLAGLVILKQLDWEKKIGEFAYSIGAEFEGRGLMTLAILKLTTYAFEELGLQTLQIIVHYSNKGSFAVAKKCGYTWQKKLLKSYTPPDGTALDMELYERFFR